MNLYFLVEGVTERKLYPKWLEHLIPSLKRVFIPEDAHDNCYYLISGGGFPGLLDNHLLASVQDINDSGNYDYFIIILDSDEYSINDRIDEVNRRIMDEQIHFKNCQFVIIVQKRCIESWLLGNKNVFSRNPTTQELIDCIQFYNVLENDPELMTKPDSFQGTVSNFHYEYLKQMLLEKNIRYTKKYPTDTLEPYYVDELRKRTIQSPDHLKTLQGFFNFCADIHQQLTMHN
jgi:hypothetical protein